MSQNETWHMNETIARSDITKNNLIRSLRAVGMTRACSLLALAGLLLTACTQRYTIDSDIPIQLDTHLEAFELEELERARQAMDEYWAQVCRPLLKPTSEDPYTIGWNQRLMAWKPIKDGVICTLYRFDEQQQLQNAKGSSDAASAVTKADGEFASTVARFSEVEDQVFQSTSFRLRSPDHHPADPAETRH